jgi:UV radiation resistance-associated gene protein
MVNLALESEASPDTKPLPSPVYFSPIHRPSTNPLFPIDTCSNQAHWPNTSGQNLKVEVWGKMPIQIEHPPTRLDEVERQPEDRNFSWKLLDEWNVNLDRLARLPNDVQTIFSSRLLTDL